MKLAGIDYSMSSPAIAVYNTTLEFDFYNIEYHFLTGKKKNVGEFGDNIFGYKMMDYSCNEERYNFISDWAMKRIYECDFVFLEGYSYGSTIGLAFNIAENTSNLKQKLWKMEIPCIIYAPPAIKKFATGKGNANKDLMHEAFFSQTEVDLKLMFNQKKKVGSPASDIVDAHFILEMGFNENA